MKLSEDELIRLLKKRVVDYCKPKTIGLSDVKRTGAFEIIETLFELEGPITKGHEIICKCATACKAPEVPLQFDAFRPELWAPEAPPVFSKALLQPEPVHYSEEAPF